MFFHRNMGAGKGDALLPFFMEKNSKGKEKPGRRTEAFLSVDPEPVGEGRIWSRNRQFQAAVFRPAA